MKKYILWFVCGEDGGSLIAIVHEDMWNFSGLAIVGGRFRGEFLSGDAVERHVASESSAAKVKRKNRALPSSLDEILFQTATAALAGLAKRVTVEARRRATATREETDLSYLSPISHTVPKDSHLAYTRPALTQIMFYSHQQKYVTIQNTNFEYEDLVFHKYETPQDTIQTESASHEMDILLYKLRGTAVFAFQQVSMPRTLKYGASSAISDAQPYKTEPPASQVRDLFSITHMSISKVLPEVRPQIALFAPVYQASNLYLPVLDNTIAANVPVAMHEVKRVFEQDLHEFSLQSVPFSLEQPFVASSVPYIVPRTKTAVDEYTPPKILQLKIVEKIQQHESTPYPIEKFIKKTPEIVVGYYDALATSVIRLETFEAKYDNKLVIPLTVTDVPEVEYVETVQPAIVSELSKIITSDDDTKMPQSAELSNRIAAANDNDVRNAAMGVLDGNRMNTELSDRLTDSILYTVVFEGEVDPVAENYLEALVRHIPNAKVRTVEYTNTLTGKRRKGKIIVDKDDPNISYEIILKKNDERQPHLSRYHHEGYNELMDKPHQGDIAKVIRRHNLQYVDSPEFDLPADSDTDLCYVEDTRQRELSKFGNKSTYGEVIELLLREMGYTNAKRLFRDNKAHFSVQKKDDPWSGYEIKPEEKIDFQAYRTVRVTVLAAPYRKAA